MVMNLAVLASFTFPHPLSEILLHGVPHKLLGDEYNSATKRWMDQAMDYDKNLASE